MEGVLVNVAAVSPERTLWCEVIKEAVNSYLFWGLGKNGTDADSFWSACRFLFYVRASKPETWQTERILREVYFDPDGVRRSHIQTLSDEVLKAGCLDSIWRELEFSFGLNEFIQRLVRERQSLLQSNWAQVVRYLRIPDDDCSLNTLVRPAGPVELARLLYLRDAQMAVAA